MASLLELHDVSMSYGAVEALRDVSLAVAEGDVLGVCGDNGAGKTTMIRIVSGAIQPTRGKIHLDGRPVSFASPRDALGQGVATIYQDLALAPRLSVAENIFMGSELTRPTPIPRLRLLDKSRMRRQAARYLEQLRISLPDMDAPVSGLSGGQRQAVAISRALRWQARIVVMDEPTAALGVKETRRVLDLIRSLRDQGVTVILISHNMDDIIAVTNRVVILKSGRKAAERRTAELTADSLSHLVMMGHA